MAKVLTDVAVRKAAKAGVSWDAATTGLGLKVLPSGTKVWVMQLRWPGRKAQTRKNIGVYPAMTLEVARERARQLYAHAKAGVDLFAVEDERRVAEERRRVAKSKNTFGAVAERYIADRTNRRAEQDAREIRRLLVSEWGTRPISSLAPRDVRQVIDAIKRRAPYDARNAWTHASGLFKWAVHEELIDVSPMASLDRRLLFRGAGIAPRQRVLDDDEVFAFWRATGRMGYPAGPLYRLLLLTGCRVSEISGARWSELHPELRRTIREAKGRGVDWAAVPDEHKVLTVPRERFKSDAEHAVQLTDAACGELERLPRLARSDLIFTANGSAPTWLGAKHKARLDARMLLTLRALARRRGDDPERVRLGGWVNHDLRRVARTNLSALGVEDHVAEMVIGHGRRGLQRVYDQHRYERQVREALEQWAARLNVLVEPAPTQPSSTPPNIIDFKRRGRQ